MEYAHTAASVVANATDTAKIMAQSAIASGFNAVPPPLTRVPKEPLLSWISDKYLALAAPVVAYWVVSMFFHVLDVFELAEKYRIHTPAELETRNKCSMRQVIVAVLAQHAMQTLIGVIVAHFEEPDMTGHEAYEIWRIGRNLNISPVAASLLYSWGFPALRMLFAFFVIDTWQYWLHRTMHVNKWLYRNLHSVHHRLYVPYAFGALYNSLLEGILLDTAGTGVASKLAGLTDRENLVLFVFSTIKTVDDHCGYEFPLDPLQIIFPNRATYHDIHHQHFGIKTNFSQPFFVHWDTMLGSKYARTEEYISHNKRLREEKAAAKGSRESVATAKPDRASDWSEASSVASKAEVKSRSRKV